jgi:trehalose 6-phosphate phosphatase
VYASRLDPDNPLVERARMVLAQAPAGLFTDVDGTISPIVSHPADARVLPAARSALSTLRSGLAVVAVVSGRRAEDARRLIGLPDLVYVGNHGLETLVDGELRIAPAAQRWLPTVGEAVAALRQRLPQPGVVVEDKGASASVHLRLAAEGDRDQARRAVENVGCRLGLRVEYGRMVVNLLPPVPIDKGSAVRELADAHQLRGLVYVGDDVTDTHAYAALADLRRRNSCAALSLAVVGPETPPIVARMADACLGSSEEVASLLQLLARGVA